MGWSFAQGKYVVRVFGDDEREVGNGLRPRATTALKLRAFADADHPQWTGIVVDSAQRTELLLEVYYAPGPRSGFHPAVALIDETDCLFVGAGNQAFSVNLTSRTLIAGHEVDAGFWQWRREADVVLMSAELQLAAFDLHGALLWTTAVEPPWHYSVAEGQLQLEVDGRGPARFPLRTGP